MRIFLTKLISYQIPRVCKQWFPNHGSRFPAKQWLNWGLDGPIRANRFADSRESPDSRESSWASRTEPLFCESRFGGLKIANRGFEAIRANRSHVMKAGVFLQIDSRESPRFALRIAGPSKNWGTVDFKKDYVLGWGIFAEIPGHPRRTNGDRQHLEARPELQDWLRSELFTVKNYRTGPFRNDSEIISNSTVISEVSKRGWRVPGPRVQPKKVPRILSPFS